jgi:carboxylesterase type B
VISHDPRGLFQRAIVESGAFALAQQPLADAETAGEAVAAQAGCLDQTAGCLRGLPVQALVDAFNAPDRFAGHGVPPAATHASELQYLFDLPNTPLAGGFSPAQEALAGSMRAAWASFAADGAPTGWPWFDSGERVMSLAPPRPQAWTGFAAAHHCAFWG